MLNMSSSRESLSKIVRQLIDQTQCSEKKYKGLFYHEFRQLCEKEAFQKCTVCFISKLGMGTKHEPYTRLIRIEISEMKINWLADLADRITAFVGADLFTEQLKSS